MRSLRAKQFDLVLLPLGRRPGAHALKLARMIKPGKGGRLCADQGLDVTVPADNKPRLEAERIPQAAAGAGPAAAAGCRQPAPFPATKNGAAALWRWCKPISSPARANH